MATAWERTAGHIQVAVGDIQVAVGDIQAAVGDIQVADMEQDIAEVACPEEGNRAAVGDSQLGEDKHILEVGIVGEDTV